MNKMTGCFNRVLRRLLLAGNESRNRSIGRLDTIAFVALILLVFDRYCTQLSISLEAGWIADLPLTPICIILLFVRMILFYLNLPWKKTLVPFGVALLGALSFLMCGQTYVLIACLLFAVPIEHDVKDCIFLIASLWLLLLVISGVMQLFIFWATGELPGAVMRNGGTIRLSFLMSHPNVLAAVALMCVVGFMLGAERLGFKEVSTCLVSALAIFLVTNSRTSSLLLIIYLVVRLIFERGNRVLRNLMRWVALLIPIACLMFVVFVCKGWCSWDILKVLQGLLTGRPVYWMIQYQGLGGFTLFGQHMLSGDVLVSGIKHVNVTIDSFYASCLLQFGLWVLVGYLALHINKVNIAFKRTDSALFATLFVCSLFGLVETYMVDLAICFPLLILQPFSCAKNRSHWYVKE